jgi:hypothetical protein
MENGFAEIVFYLEFLAVDWITASYHASQNLTSGILCLAKSCFDAWQFRSFVVAYHLICLADVEVISVVSRGEV